MLQKTRSLITSITLGSILEWYELILFIYWAPIISRLFFDSQSDQVGLLNSLFVFAIGFLARPLGGFLFGYLGDKLSRRKVFIFSIVIMSIPTFLIGFIPLYSQIGYWSSVILAMLRIFQNLPAGGELPGAICYLYESAGPQNKNFVTSFSLIGPTLGTLIAIIECTLMKKYMSYEFLIDWGWRISFMFGGVIGLSGLVLRRKLHETPSFLELERKRQQKEISHKEESIWKYRKNIVRGFCASILQIVAYVMVSMVPILYSTKLVSFDYSEHLIISAIMIIIYSLTMLIFGKLGDRYGRIKMLKWSAAATILISYPLYEALTGASLILTIFVVVIFIILASVHFALIPALVAQLFPTWARFTGVALSFNLCDSIVVSITPPLAIYLAHSWGAIASCSVILSIAAAISFISFFYIKENIPS